MDSDRKYRQHGYLDTGHESRPFREGGQKPQGPRLPLDVTGPRLPRLVQHVAASRCYNCSATLPEGTDFSPTGTCPKCHADLHCCKQCTHFEPSTRFQCQKPIPARIAAKDKANECLLFSRRVTVAREGVSSNGSQAPMNNGAATGGPPAPRNADDARTAFDRLFKKS